VSWYKVIREQVTSQGTQSFIAGTGAVAVPTSTDLSRGQEQGAKTMTSLLIIPSVLGFRSNFFFFVLSFYFITSKLAPGLYYKQCR